MWTIWKIKFKKTNPIEAGFLSFERIQHEVWSDLFYCQAEYKKFLRKSKETNTASPVWGGGH